MYLQMTRAHTKRTLRIAQAVLVEVLPVRHHGELFEGAYREPMGVMQAVLVEVLQASHHKEA